MDIVIHKGKFGPYLKYGDRNISLPRGKDPMKVTEAECVALITAEMAKTPVNAVIREFPGSGISIMNGRYGPYLKRDGQNYKIPKGKEASALTEQECLEIVSSSDPTARSKRRYPKK